MPNSLYSVHFISIRYGKYVKYIGLSKDKVKILRPFFCPFLQQLKDMGFDVSILVVALSACAIVPFSYCYFGKMTTDAYASMPDRLFESNWQQLSINLQKYVILMIGNMHKPLFYHGYGILILNLETFRDVRAMKNKILLFKYLIDPNENVFFQLFRNIITYYMMFKAIT